MKNFKLILRSLVNNNACIDGGRYKKWYFAVIMFFLSIILAIVPTFVKTIKTNGDDVFANVSYATQEATYDFSKHIAENDTLKMYVKYNESNDSKTLVVDGWTEDYQCKNAKDETVFIFYYTPTINDDYLNSIKGDGKTSFFVFSETMFCYNVVNPTSKEAVVSIACRDAYKKFDEGYDIKSLLSKEADTTNALNETWTNWKDFIRKAYDFNRLTALWQQCVIIGSIDIVITLLMGFMIWILTRGKNNPYRYFKLLESMRVSCWAMVAPAILTCGLGFLFANFANVLFPLLLGIRVMWLSTKSLRPDGTGYAAN